MLRPNLNLRHLCIILGDERAINEVKRLLIYLQVLYNLGHKFVNKRV